MDERILRHAAYTNDRAVLDKTCCQARSEVAAWVSRHGKESVVQLLDAVAQGQNFATLYGVLLTQ